MKRDLINTLKIWKNSPNRKPLILRGARQVGKSWLARELAKNFDNLLEINFEKNSDFISFFQDNISPDQLIENISNFTQKRITPGKTLLFLDEIQACPRAISALRYFYEDMPQLHVISAGSLLEFELRHISIPVGRVNFIYVYPFSFAEYLEVSGNTKLRDMLLNNELDRLPAPFHKKLIDEVRNYSIVGGMPEAIKSYINNGNFEESLEVQTDLLETYRTDFHKYAKDHQIKYLEKVFNSIPLQLGRKFKYSTVANDIRSIFLGEALNLLEMAGLAYKVYHSSANGIPLGAEIDPKKFKVLFFDIGLAQRLLKLDYRNLLMNPDLTQINNGAVAELFAGLEFITYSNPREKSALYYWHREARSSNAEVDYVTTLDGEIIPVEVKSCTIGKMKSLKMFLESKKQKTGLKISGAPYSIDNNILSIPFYAIEKLIRGKR